MQPLPILLIGHGYLGSALAARLHSLGHRVTAVAREPVSPVVPYPTLSADVCSAEAIQDLASRVADDPPKLLIHCASSSRGGPDSYRRVFLDGMRHLLDAFPHTPILFTSSTSVYGQTGGECVDEDSPTDPDRETSRILCQAEQLVTTSGGVALRLAGIYGPHRSAYLTRLLEGSATIETGPVSRFLNQIHRDDAVSAVCHLAGRPDLHRGRIFNVADNTPLTQRECLEASADFLGIPRPPEAPPNLERKRAWTHKQVSNAALRATGWSPVHPSFLDALQNDPELVASIRAQVEGSENRSASSTG